MTLFASSDESQLNPRAVPNVSWLLCTHISNKYLKLSIDSCLNQSFEDFELIIVLNGPQRNRIEADICSWFPMHPKIRIYKTEIQHLIFSLNLGLHFSRGKYIARMDSDDISSPNRLKCQVDYMDSHPNISVLGTAYNIIDEDGMVIQRVNNPLSNKAIRRSLFFKNPINHPSVMMRKSLIQGVGGYMGAIHAEDYDLWCRLSLEKSNHFANLQDPFISYRVFGVAGARKSRRAYATQAGTQINNFLLTANIFWLLGCMASTAKIIFLSKIS